MSDNSETTLTNTVIDQFSGTKDPRLKTILTSFTRHLHAVAIETSLSVEEWSKGIEFLTRVGHKCDDSRQEFILLSDVLGLSTLVDAIDHREQDAGTDSTILGPFYVENAAHVAHGANIAAGIDGDPLYVCATISDTHGQPLPNADITIWQCGNDGLYDVQHADRDGFFLRGQLRSDAEGCVRFWTIAPPPYSIPYDGPVGDLLSLTGRHPWRPAHIHFKIVAPGHQTLVTHLFEAGGDYLESDVVFAVKPSLIVAFPKNEAGVGPEGRDCPEGWKSLTHTFHLVPTHS